MKRKLWKNIYITLPCVSYFVCLVAYVLVYLFNCQSNSEHVVPTKASELRLSVLHPAYQSQPRSPFTYPVLVWLDSLGLLRWQIELFRHSNQWLPGSMYHVPALLNPEPGSPKDAQGVEIDAIWLESTTIAAVPVLVVVAVAVEAVAKSKPNARL